MFKSANAKRAVEELDWSQLLRDRNSFVPAHLANLGLGAELTAHAHDPVQGLLAIGTEAGGLVVLGGEGVQLTWDLGRPLKVKHLAFKAGSGLLCVVDSKDTLSVYDLSILEGKTSPKPARASSLSMRSVITCIEASATLPFLFLGGKDGTVDIYDLDRGCLAASSRIPNLWLVQEEILRRSGVSDAPSRRHIPVCTDIKLHPLDLNLLLVAYEGGVTMWNITKRQAERNWEFVVPPGAAGGGNDREDEIFTERRPAVTCLAWRPDGLMFAVGHEDGCITFASVDDENPIAMRTIERADVNKATEEDLFGWSAQGDAGHRKPADREPIFRLAWSAFPEETVYEKAVAGGWIPTSPTVRSPLIGSFAGSQRTEKREEKITTKGGTVLTILGGLLPKDPMGIHLLEFPGYVAPSATTTSNTGNIAPVLRDALKESVQPLQHNLYATSSPPEDFLLLPRSNPHFGMAYDPTSILITTGADSNLPVLAAPHSRRGLEAWSFPPTAATPSRRLRLPPALAWSGPSTATQAKIYNLPSHSYARILHQLEFSDHEDPRLALGGGAAIALPRLVFQNRVDLHPQPRILVTAALDTSIQFWDISDSLLAGNPETGVIEADFPRELGHLRVDIRALLRDGMARELEGARVLGQRPWEVEVVKVDLAPESLELAVQLSTGEVLLFRLVYGQDQQSVWQANHDLGSAETAADATVNDALADLSLSRPSAAATAPPTPPSPSVLRKSHRKKSIGSKSTTSYEPSADAQDLHVDLSFVPALTPWRDGFRPVSAFKLPSTTRNPCLAMSNIGFLAASSDAGLLIVDMRGPEVLLFESSSGAAEVGKGKSKQKTDSSPITSLHWIVASLGQDHDRAPRLVVVQQSGSARVFELSQVAGSWLLNSQVANIHHDSAARAFNTFVLDKFGVDAAASANNLQLALAHQNDFQHGDVDAKGALTSLLVVVTPAAVSAYFNVDGSKTAQYDGEGFSHAALATRMGYPVVVVATKDQNVIILSLPDLTFISRVSFGSTVHAEVGEISFSGDGDFVQVADPFSIRLHTLFDIGRYAFPPTLTVHRLEMVVPAQLNPLTAVKSTFSSFFGGQKVYTAHEVEAALGGPDRPPPKVKGAPSSTVQAAREHARAARSPTVAQQVQGDADSTTTIMARTQQALAERGESITYLQERLGTMATDAAKFASDAAKQAKQEAAKATLKNSMASYWSKMV